MCMQNLKSVAFPVPEIIRGTQKIWAITGYAHASFSPKFFMGFYSECQRLNVFGMYWLNLKSVAFPVPEIIGGTRKNWAVPGYAHAPLSLKFLMGFCSDGPSECTGQI